MKKQLLVLLLTLLPMLTMADRRGECGDNVTWTYNEYTWRLTIQGSGAMKNYSSSSQPWYHFRTNIQNIFGHWRWCFRWLLWTDLYNHS